MRYCYKCDKCGYVFDKYHSAKNRNKTEQCPECLSPAYRSFKNEIKDSKVDALMKENERYSWSMGCNVDDIPDMIKKFPGSEYNDRGQLRIKNREHKKFEMKRRGFEEYN